MKPRSWRRSSSQRCPKGYAPPTSPLLMTGGLEAWGLGGLVAWGLGARWLGVWEALGDLESGGQGVLEAPEEVSEALGKVSEAPREDLGGSWGESWSRLVRSWKGLETPGRV